MKQPSLKPQDVVVLVRLLLDAGKPTFSELAKDLSLSASEIHASTFRSRASGLLVSDSERTQVVRPALREFVVHGIKYAFPAIVGQITQGMPTAAGGPTLSRNLMAAPEGHHVWPSSTGTSRGPSLIPLYPTLPMAASRNDRLYDVMSMIDALRVGASREREIARKELMRFFG